MSRRQRPRPRLEPSIRDDQRFSQPLGRARQQPPESPRPGRRRARAFEPAPSLEGVTLALVLLRVFLGATFIYAGLDKLIDPAFLRTAGAGSIGAQLASFVHSSPIGILVEIFGRPFPILTGLVVSLVEIAIGLATLSGLLFRLAAAGGALLSITFWLTASWQIKPYYYGPDLPYAAGWITLLIAGPGGRFLLDPWLRRLAELDSDDDPTSIERRQLLQGAVLGLGALAVATLGGTLGAWLFGRSSGSDLAATASPDPANASLAPTAVPSGPSIGTISALGTGGGSLAFQDPSTGDPGVLVQLPNGKVVAFDAVCTHAGCTVEYDSGSHYLICPCHGATFDPRRGAAVVAGPTDQPLIPLPISVDSRTGTISLVG
jgi:thiosulfate dehydrogenase [quinone] large subunit